MVNSVKFGVYEKLFKGVQYQQGALGSPPFICLRMCVSCATQHWVLQRDDRGIMQGKFEEN